MSKTKTQTEQKQDEQQQQQPRRKKMVARPARMKRLPRYGEGETTKRKLVDGAPAKRMHPRTMAKRRQKFYAGETKHEAGSTGSVVPESAIKTNIMAAKKKVLAGKLAPVLPEGANYNVTAEFITNLALAMHDYLNRMMQANATISQTGDSADNKKGRALQAASMLRVNSAIVSMIE